MEPLNDRNVNLVTPVDLQCLHGICLERRVLRRQGRHLVEQLIVLGVLIAREAVVAGGRADRCTVTAVVELERRVRVLQACAMAEHIQTGNTLGHVLVGIRAEVTGRIEAGLPQHFDQHRNDVAVNAFKAVDRCINGLAVLLPQIVAVLREAGRLHELRALLKVELSRLILLFERLYLRRIDECLQSGVERERIDGRDLCVLINDFVNLWSVDREADRAPHIHVTVRL